MFTKRSTSSTKWKAENEKDDSISSWLEANPQPWCSSRYSAYINGLWASKSCKSFASRRAWRPSCCKRTSSTLWSPSSLTRTISFHWSFSYFILLTSSRKADSDAETDWIINSAVSQPDSVAARIASNSGSWGPWPWTWSSLTTPAFSTKRRRRSANHNVSAAAASSELRGVSCDSSPPTLELFGSKVDSRALTCP